jgi:hypothetical protein
MAIYADLSGNSPFGVGFIDPSIGTAKEIDAISFSGTSHKVTLGSSAVQTPVFSRRCKAILITMEGTGEANIALGSNPTAVKDSDIFLTAGVPLRLLVRGGTDRLSVIQQASETNKMTVTENLS